MRALSVIIAAIYFQNALVLLSTSTSETDYPCVSKMAYEPYVPLYLTLQRLSLQSFYPKVTFIQSGREGGPRSNPP